MPSAIRVVTQFQSQDDVSVASAIAVANSRLWWSDEELNRKTPEAGAINYAQSNFYDDFARADQTGLGDTPTGQTWVLVGPGAATAGISNGKFVSPDDTTHATYVFPAGQKPIKIGGKFQLGHANAGVAIIFSSREPFESGASPPVVYQMVHMTMSTVGGTLTWWDSPSNDQAANYISRTGTQSLSVDTEYEIYMTIWDNTVRVDLPDGTSLWGWDSHFSALAGNTIDFEIFSDTAQTAGTSWNEVRVYQESVLNVPQGIRANYFDGQLGTKEHPANVVAQTVRVYTQGTGQVFGTGYGALGITNNLTGQPGIYLDSNVVNGSSIILQTTSADATLEPKVEFRQNNATPGVKLYLPASTAMNQLRLNFSASDKFVWFANGNVGFSTTAQFGSGVGVLGIAKATTAPTVATTNAGVLYIDPTTGDLMYWGSSGVARTVAAA